ncbi:MAG: cupin, partial [Acidimicrobiales bacterium]
ASNGTSSPTPLLIGRAGEDWTGDAVFAEYSEAADPIGSGAIAPVPIHSFPAALHHGDGTRLVPLDLSADLGVPGPATSPGLLAAFCVLEPGDAIITEPEATSELYYCLEGDGATWLSASSPDGRGTMSWAAGDFFVLPACSAYRHVGGQCRAVLYRVTDAPLLDYLGVTATSPRFAPTRYDGDRTLALLAEIESQPASAGRNRISVLLGNVATPETLTATHTLWAMLGVLPAGHTQRPHRHQSVALDLITACRAGCYTLIGAEIDQDGVIVDPVRVDWEAGGAFVTPPGLWHSHHNESELPARLVPVQDAGLQTYLRSLDIRFASGS